MTCTIVGFHGTSKANTSKIIKSGFKPSITNKEWLGKGCYFFINGLSSEPQNQAMKWACISAWDNENKQNSYLFYAVLKCLIKVDEELLLDLTTPEGVKTLDYIEERSVTKLCHKPKSMHYIDNVLIEFAREVIGYQVIKGNLFIKLSKNQRVQDLSRRTQNCTVCCVVDPLQNVNNIELIKTGGI